MVSIYSHGRCRPCHVTPSIPQVVSRCQASPCGRSGSLLMPPPRLSKKGGAFACRYGPAMPLTLTAEVASLKSPPPISPSSSPLPPSLIPFPPNISFFPLASPPPPPTSFRCPFPPQSSFLPFPPSPSPPSPSPPFASLHPLSLPLLPVLPTFL